MLYVVMGSSSRMNFGPDAVVSALIGRTYLDLQSSPDFIGNQDGLLQTLTFFVGLFALGFGLLRLGYLDSLLAHTVVSGAMEIGMF